MNRKVITGIVIATVIVGLLGYDVWAYFQHADSTISEWIWEMSKTYPIIPFSGGLLVGHLWL